VSQLKNKAVLITGATSGMGAAAAELAAARGAAVMLFGRDRERADLVRAAIVANGGAARTFIGDVADPLSARSAVEAVCAVFGRIDGLVNAAGIIYRGNAGQTSDEDWARVMRINVDGTFYTSRAAVQHMRSGGSIVNFGSTVGSVGAPGLTAYCVSKGAVAQLTRAMALDHAREGIRVNAVCPGAVDTPMLLSGHERAGKSAADVHASNLAEIPQGRIPTASEVAELVVFLLSDASAHMTGANIPIDGGYTAQ